MATVWIYDGCDSEIIPFSNPKKAYDKLKSIGRLEIRDPDYPDYYNPNGLPSYKTFLGHFKKFDAYNTVCYLDNYGDGFRVYKRQII